ncbi:DNA-binding protein [Pseudoalteromonas phenolica]|uniref:ribbon-helix-helix domain-containing protein n=1 Tax=Pseudoalteromonas phenolica TaxID=161398 RepID=UPI00110B5FEB|nr:ribbon-helix-helix domain-containing protein [Pseudoalteromonas phenolica]TMN93521.1 DNA-binding protein [Pseudoalteromonas phenolica]
MCELYSSQPQDLYETTKRSVRIQGVVTSISLENQVWQLLEQIASTENRSVADFISTLYQEVIERHGSVKNLASMLRVTCLTYALNNK